MFRRIKNSLLHYRNNFLVEIDIDFLFLDHKSQRCKDIIEQIFLKIIMEEETLCQIQVFE